MLPPRKHLRTPCAIAAILASFMVVVPANAQAVAPDAQQPSGTETITYTPADFARFSPRTALDMVEHIPDFALSETSDDRGIGQASQNVLVNGQRVAGKSNDASTALQQISATAVVRIELTDGARLGIPGLTGRVANVIVRSSAVRVQFRWEGQQRRNIEDQIFTGSVSMSGRVGASDFTLSLSNNDGIRRGGRGPEIVTGAAGTILLTRDEFDSFHRDTPRLAGTLHREWTDGSILNLNLSGQYEMFITRLAAVATPVGGTTRDEYLRSAAYEWGVEGGGDYEFAVGNGRLKIIALQSFVHDPTTVTFRRQNRAVGAVASGDRFIQAADTGESVLRSEYGWQTPHGSWQFSLEGAYNFADVTASLGSLQPDGSYTPIPLNGATTFVDEIRAEALATRGITLAQGLTLQTTIGAEYSHIRQTSAGGLSRSFIRPKGALALSWTASPRLTVNAEIRRRVGQLRFEDFAAAVDLINGNASAGNTNLVPEQSWRAELEFARSLGGFGSLTMGGFAERISDIVDSIPISATEEGIGNLPRATRYGVTARGTFNLDVLGWRGARIDANATFNHSSVLDPVTGIHRRISDDQVRSWSIDLRHDIPNSPIAWGAGISDTRLGPLFRLDQYYNAVLTRPFALVYAEHKDVLGLTVRLSLRNLLSTSDLIVRDTYVNRRNGPIAFRERQIRNIYLFGALTISGSF